MLFILYKLSPKNNFLSIICLFWSLIRKKIKKTNHKDRSWGSKVFANGEDAHTLRLASKLADLRAEYVNLLSLREISSNQTLPNNKIDLSRLTGLFCWQG